VGGGGGALLLSREWSAAGPRAPINGPGGPGGWRRCVETGDGADERLGLGRDAG